MIKLSDLYEIRDYNSFKSIMTMYPLSNSSITYYHASVLLRDFSIYENKNTGITKIQTRMNGDYIECKNIEDALNYAYEVYVDLFNNYYIYGSNDLINE